MRTVRFIQEYVGSGSSYHGGEIAGFSEEHAGNLVRAGIAVYHPKEGPAEAKSAEGKKSTKGPPAHKMVSKPNKKKGKAG